MIRLNDDFDAIMDLAIPGWFPIPLKKTEDQTQFSGVLAPGDWTLYLLSYSDGK
jgi:hypothetical protein